MPDCGLEDVDVLVDAEVEALAHPLLGLLELVAQPHDVHRVEGVDQREAEAEPVLKISKLQLARLILCMIYQND